MSVIIKIKLFNLLLVLKMTIFLTGCTYSITMVHTQGQATDVVDEAATNTPSTSIVPTINVPI
jgi:hypothetical protein